ncbi:Ig-like domain-containing protein [Actinomycetospora sp. CA-084318]|uniref:Ig-like domain-containing protein n=1 Tax=Actinomycetospora sp. CA-084318 TaxID=3239892 RepID=UPI003D9830B6
MLTRIALGLAGVLPPSGPTTPTAPAAPSSALLLAQWALFRRGGSVFNQSPSASPTQAPSTTGQVTGNLNATDPDGDRLTYSIVGQPARGAVVVNPDGTFVYTADAALARTGGTDSFTVLVRDNAPGRGQATDALRGLLGRHHPVLADRLFGPHAIAVTVPVVVASPATNTPPVVPSVPPVPTTERMTGVVTGSLGVRDDDGDPLEFTVVGQPGVGTVTVDRATGTYTFTPTAAARRVAAGTPGTDTVTFEVLVSDGRGEAVSVPVTVVVDPGPAEVVAAIPVGTGPQSLYASPDGRRLYAVGAGGSSLATARTFAALDAPAPSGTVITVIDAGSNTLISSIAVPGRVDEVLFSPDGGLAFVTSRTDESYYSDPAAITVIDTATDSVVRTIEAQGPHGGVYFAPDGRHAYLSDQLGDTVYVVDTANGSLTTIETPSPQYLTFSPDGRRAYMPSITDGRTVVIDTATHTVIGSVPGYGQPVFGPDGRYTYVVDTQAVDGTVTVIDTADDSVDVIPVGRYPSWIQFGADGRYAFVSNIYGGGDQRLTVIDTADHSFATIDLGTAPDPMQMSAGGTRGYLVDRQDGTVTIIDTARGVLVDTIDTTDYAHSTVLSAQFAPDGSKFYVQDLDRLTIIDVADDSVATLDSYGRFGFTPDGSHAYLLGWEPEGSPLTLISVADDSTRTFVGPVYVNDVTFSPDGSRAFLTNWDGVVSMIDTSDGSTTTVAVGTSAGTTPVFSRDGRQAFYVDPGQWGGGPDGESLGSGAVTVVDVATGQAQRIALGSGAYTVTFSPDGTRAFLISDRTADGSTVTVIDRSDSTATTFTAGPYASEVEFTPDGRFGYVFAYGTGPDDGEVVFIDLADGSRSSVPVPSPSGIRFSANGRYAYVLNQRDGTATVIELDSVGDDDGGSALA